MGEKAKENKAKQDKTKQPAKQTQAGNFTRCLVE